jgi:hypothetical protein
VWVNRNVQCVMNEWNTIYSMQMANNLVKWWKTKFLNGYKPFTGKTLVENRLDSCFAL